MINNNLKFCRESLEMTQKELGYVFGVAESTVSGWENNNDIMPLTKLVKFCDLYGFSLDYVTGLTRSIYSYSKITIHIILLQHKTYLHLILHTASAFA